MRHSHETLSWDAAGAEVGGAKEATTTDSISRVLFLLVAFEVADAGVGVQAVWVRTDVDDVVVGVGVGGGGRLGIVIDKGW